MSSVSPEATSIRLDSWLLTTSIIGLALLVVCIVMIYRTMQRPRLGVSVRDGDGMPTLTWQAIVRYLVTAPIMVLFWFSAILFILSWAAQGRSSEELIIGAAAVVGGARLLAHFDEEMARELGKTIPLAIIGVIIIGRSSATQQEFSRALEGIEANSGAIDDFYYLLVIFDIVVTFAWFGVSWWVWRLRHSPLEGKLSRAGELVTYPLKAIRDFGRANRGA